MHFPADTVAGEFADRAEPVRFGVTLDRVAHVAEPVPNHALAHCLPEAFLGHPDQLFRLFADGSDAGGKRGVGLPAVEDQRAVHGKDVAFLQPFRA